MSNAHSTIHSTAGGGSPRRKNIVRLLVLLLLALLVFGGVLGARWVGNRMMVQYLENMPVPTATITAGTVQSMSWDNRLEAIGTLMAVNGADLTTEIGGIVREIHFESGDRAERGQLLLSLDADEDRGEWRRLQAQAELADLGRQRVERLYGLESVSRSDYDTAVAEANAARAAAEAQQARVALKEIRAPFTGELGVRRVNVGQYLSPGDAIVTLQSLDPVDVDFNLPEQYVGAVEAGYTVRVRVNAYPDRVFEGRIIAVEPRVSEATRNFVLRARLPNPDRMLRPGQFGRVVLNLPGEREVVAIPRTAVHYSSYGTSVFVVREGRPGDENNDRSADGDALHVVQRFVRTGDARGDFVAVTEGLEPGERVATSGLLKLRNEQPVVINNEIVPDVQLEPTPPQT